MNTGVGETQLRTVHYILLITLLPMFADVPFHTLSSFRAETLSFHPHLLTAQGNLQQAFGKMYKNMRERMRYSITDFEVNNS